MRPSGTHLYKICSSVCPSVGLSVGQSVGQSLTPVQKPRFSAVFGHGEILYWNKWSTNMSWEPFPPVCSSICLSIYVTWSIHIETQPGRIVAWSGLFLLASDLVVMLKFSTSASWLEYPLPRQIFEPRGLLIIMLFSFLCEVWQHCVKVSRRQQYESLHLLYEAFLVFPW